VTVVWRLECKLRIIYISSSYTWVIICYKSSLTSSPLIAKLKLYNVNILLICEMNTSLQTTKLTFHTSLNTTLSKYLLVYRAFMHWISFAFRVWIVLWNRNIITLQTTVNKSSYISLFLTILWQQYNVCCNRLLQNFFQNCCHN